MRYTPSATALQEIEREWSKSAPRETSAMRAKINAARPLQDLKRAIIQEWLTGCYDEHDALYWLKTFRLHSGASTGDTYCLMSDAALAAFGDVELPERSTAPVPSVSSSRPFQLDGGAS